jgi:uncharacterized Zn-binding protein involved in type VI secretion
MKHKVIVSTDVTNGHNGGCTSVRLNSTSFNTDVFINGKYVLVGNDVFTQHTNRGCGGHTTTINPLKCSLNVKINGKPVAVDSGLLSCNDVLVSSGQDNVFIGDAPI